MLFDALANGGVAAYGRTFLWMMGVKPPLIAALAGPFYLFLGRNYRYACLVNAVFAVVLAILLYALGRRFRNDRTGFIAAFLGGAMPLLYGLSRWYLTEYGLTVLVWLTVLLLVNFRVWEVRSAALLGLACGLGMLMKTTYPLYVCLPFAYYFGMPVLRAPGPVRNKALLAFIGPALVLSLPWYAINFRAAMGHAFNSSFTEMADFYGTGAVFSPPALITYLQRVLNQGVGSWYALLWLCIGLLLFIRRVRHSVRRALRAPAPLLACFALTFLVFLFSRNKDIRFVAPLLPAAALAIALDAVFECIGMWRWAAAPLALALPLFGFLQTTFGLLPSLSISSGGFVLASTELGYARIYDRNHRPQRDLFNTLYRSAIFHGGESKLILLGTDLATFNADTFQLFATQGRLPFGIHTTAYERSLPILVESLANASFFIYQEGGNAEKGFFNRQKEFAQAWVRNAGEFRESPESYPTPDGGRIRVFVNARLAR